MTLILTMLRLSKTGEETKRIMDLWNTVYYCNNMRMSCNKCGGLDDDLDLGLCKVCESIKYDNEEE